MSEPDSGGFQVGGEPLFEDADMTVCGFFERVLDSGFKRAVFRKESCEIVTNFCSEGGWKIMIEEGLTESGNFGGIEIHQCEVILVPCFAIPELFLTSFKD